MRIDDHAGLRMPQARIRDERIAIAHEMVLKTLHEAAGFPVPQQQALREVVKHLQALQTWCRTHASGAGTGT
jgi:hypothetical protein